MPIKERKLYKIGQLASLLGMTHRTIRYYDQVGLLPKVKRSDGGMRLFDDQDLELIKKIKRLQTEEYLPLEVIKDRLYGKAPDSPLDLSIVTDESVMKTKAHHDSVHSLPVTCTLDGVELTGKKATPTDIWGISQKKKALPVIQSPSEDTFIEKFKYLKDKGYSKVYSIHPGQAFSGSFQRAKVAALKVASLMDVEVIDSKSTGLGTALLVQRVSEAIEAKQSKETIDILIKQQIPLIYTVGILGSLSPLVIPGLQKDSSFINKALTQSIASFVPVFTLKDGTGQLDIDVCLSDKDKALAHLKTLIDSEFQKRGKYMAQIKVSYNYLFSEAQSLSNYLKTTYPSTPVLLEQAPLSTVVEFGQEFIGVSII